LEDSGINGRVILKWISEHSVRRAWTGFIWLRTKDVAGCYVRAKELLYSLKFGNFLNSWGIFQMGSLLHAVSLVGHDVFFTVLVYRAVRFHRTVWMEATTWENALHAVQ
jgi:hypothetical protein